MADPKEQRDEQDTPEPLSDFEQWSAEQDALDILWHGDNDEHE